MLFLNADFPACEKSEADPSLRYVFSVCARCFLSRKWRREGEESSIRVWLALRLFFFCACSRDFFPLFPRDQWWDKSHVCMCSKAQGCTSLSFFFLLRRKPHLFAAKPVLRVSKQSASFCADHPRRIPHTNPNIIVAFLFPFSFSPFFLQSKPLPP